MTLGGGTVAYVFLVFNKNYFQQEIDQIAKFIKNCIFAAGNFFRSMEVHVCVEFHLKHKSGSAAMLFYQMPFQIIEREDGCADI